MKYFGTDGFRGRVNETLTVDHAVMIGKYLGFYFRNKKGSTPKCVIGKDTRKSSYMYEYALVAGLTSTGADVHMLHVTTTPSVSYLTRTGDFDFGIMITASHNPYFDNGIKVIDSNGFKMEESVLEKIEDFIDGKTELELSPYDKIGCCRDYMQGRNKYISYLTSIPTETMRGYRIGLDCANGASFSIAKTVFDILGAKTFVINAEPDGMNINYKCGSTHIEGLQKYVVENDLDAGFAFDGDADRCLAVDNKGNVIDGDLIIYMCALYLKEHNQLVKDTVVTTVMSNMGLTKALREHGIENVQTPVGDKYISAKIQENGYSVGGEQSGHIIFNKYGVTGDGILTAIIIMDILVAKKTTLSSMFYDITIFPQCLTNVKVSDMAVAQDERLVRFVDEVNESMGENGRAFLRKSGTEPLIRILTEDIDEKVCEEKNREIENKIKELDR